MNMPNDNDNPIKYRRADDFTDSYANNVFFEPSVWDLRFIFGQLDSGEIVQHSAISVPWIQVRIMQYYLALNLAMYEYYNGKVPLPQSVVPAKPIEPSAEMLASDPAALEVWKIFTQIHQQFFPEKE
jgi:hypothetical protein